MKSIKLHKYLKQLDKFTKEVEKTTQSLDEFLEKFLIFMKSVDKPQKMKRYDRWHGRINRFYFQWCNRGYADFSWKRDS